MRLLQRPAVLLVTNTSLPRFKWLHQFHEPVCPIIFGEMAGFEACNQAWTQTSVWIGIGNGASRRLLRRGQLNLAMYGVKCQNLECLRLSRFHATPESTHGRTCGPSYVLSDLLTTSGLVLALHVALHNTSPIVNTDYYECLYELSFRVARSHAVDLTSSQTGMIN